MRIAVSPMGGPMIASVLDNQCVITYENALQRHVLHITDDQWAYLQRQMPLLTQYIESSGFILDDWQLPHNWPELCDVE